MNFKKCLSFDDVILLPQYSAVSSRADVDLSTKICGLDLGIPIIAANMSSVCEVDMCMKLGRLGGLGILHRFCTPYEQRKMCWDISNDFIGSPFKFGFSIGLDDWEERMELCGPYADIVCLDIAHADCKRVLEMLCEFFKLYPKYPIIIGQISTDSAFNRLTTFVRELDITTNHIVFKGSISGGSHCTTRVATGFGNPTLQFLLDINKIGGNKPGVIADGGIRNSGDIAKCIAAGANAVMLGSMLAGTDEAPGEIITTNDGKKYKQYFGSASYSQKSQSGIAKNIEGVSSLVPYKGPVENVIHDILDGLRSACSYSGAFNLSELKRNSIFAEVSNAGWREGTPHGL